MTDYLTLAEVIAIHQRLIEDYGGVIGIRDQDLLEAAVMRPQSGYYVSLIEKAAALWESLTLNHAFIDGNKRIGFAATLIFLEINGYGLTASQNETANFILTSLEEDDFKYSTILSWLEENVKSFDR